MRGKIPGILVGLALAAAPTSEATPRYSMMVGQQCNLCHHNPGGGGQRSLYASQYLLPTRLAMQIETEAQGVSPQIGDDVIVGADLRTFYYQEDRERLDNFVQMQGSAYVSLQLDPRFSAYLHQEFGQSQSNVQAYEIYGMGFVLPWTGHVKVGKFVPAFGWRQADHRTFTRRDFVFLPALPPHSDTGIEVGIRPGSFSVQAAVVNGGFSGGFDRNSDVAVTARASWRWNPAPFNLALGGSLYRDGARRIAGPASEKRTAAGPFAGAHWGRATWIGELDWVKSESSSGSGDKTAFTTSHELAVEIWQGFDAVLTYDFHDPDVDFETGFVRRTGMGLDALPYPFLAVRTHLYFFEVEAGPDLSIEAGFPADLTEDVTQFAGEIQFLY